MSRQLGTGRLLSMSLWWALLQTTGEVCQPLICQNLAPTGSHCMYVLLTPEPGWSSHPCLDVEKTCRYVVQSDRLRQQLLAFDNVIIGSRVTHHLMGLQPTWLGLCNTRNFF